MTPLDTQFKRDHFVFDAIAKWRALSDQINGVRSE